MQSYIFFSQTHLFLTPPRRRGYGERLQLCVKLRTLRGDARQFGETEGNKYSDSGFCFRKNPRHSSDRLGCLHLLLRAFFVYTKLYFTSPTRRRRGYGEKLQVCIKKTYRRHRKAKTCEKKIYLCGK